MLVPVSDVTAVLLSSLAWFGVSVAVGRAASRWPVARVARAGPVTRLRPWEDQGRWWHRHLAVRRWKDRIPEAGAVFADGYPKRSVRSRSTADLERFRAETIRAERVHWLIWASTPLHLVWCGPGLFAAMVVFGVAFNAPFIVIQRANRGRIEAIVGRRRAVSLRLATTS